MKHLVLGSSGQIGSHLCEVIENFPGLGTYLEYDIAKNLKQDLRKPCEYLRYCVEEADYIYFLAFDVGGSRYLKARDSQFDFVHNNMAIMYQTFDVLKDYPNKRLLFTSSQMSNMGHSNYGRLKAVGESYTLAYGGLVSKFWNVFGVERDPEKSHVITDFIKSALRTGEINMMTDGTESRQFLHATTASIAMLELLINSYNNIDQRDNLHITSFQWHTIREVADLISKVIMEKTSEDITVYPGPGKDSVQLDTKNEPNSYILDKTERWFRKEFTDLQKGIEAVVDWEIQNLN